MLVSSYSIIFIRFLLILHVLHSLALDRRTTESDSDATASATDPQLRITAIMPYSKGFACAAGAGVVYLYEKTGEYDYMKTKEIRVSGFIFNIRQKKL